MPPFNYPALSYNLADGTASGQNLYLPIPYQKSCKVVADKDWGNYYHFNYATYPAGTVLPTFSAELAAGTPRNSRRSTTSCRETSAPIRPASGPANRRSTPSFRVDPGETARVARLDGPQAITALWVKTQFADRADEMAGLRKLALRITWDGQRSRPCGARWAISSAPPRA